MIVLGIDIGFTDRSLARSPYAPCASLRREVVALYLPPEEGKPDALAPYREMRPYLALHRLQEQEPPLYRRAIEEMGLPPFLGEVPWADAVRKALPPDLRRALEAYVEVRPHPWISLERVPSPVRERLVKQVGEEERASAWDALPWRERTERYCKGCPIRPAGEETCSLRFSSYPGMNTFREGFLIALLYASTLEGERLQRVEGTFRHLDRSKGEVPRDKIQGLQERLRGVEVNKGPEMLFNRLVDMLEKLAPPGTDMDTERIKLTEAPFVDQFISAFIYRDTPYSPGEARGLLPSFETLLDVADSALRELRNPWMRHRLLAFRERLQALVTALQIAERYEVEAYVSY